MLVTVAANGSYEFCHAAVKTCARVYVYAGIRDSLLGVGKFSLKKLVAVYGAGLEEA